MFFTTKGDISQKNNRFVLIRLNINRIDRLFRHLSDLTDYFGGDKIFTGLMLTNLQLLTLG